MKRTLFLIVFFSVAFHIYSQSSGWKLRLMPQAAIGGRNTVQRPNNDEGTRVSLNSEFNRKNNIRFSPRIELEYNYNRHHFIATAALLNDKFEGIGGRDIMYDGTLFNVGNNLETDYKFNTYRLGYRYRLVDQPQLAFELGATLLFRDAHISMENDMKKAKFSNFGVAPLISYYLEWKTTERFSLLTYGDAFAIKIGRAEDVFAGAKYQFTPKLSGIAGYRLLEGGSDGDEVYTMSAFHFISLGIGIDF